MDKQIFEQRFMKIISTFGSKNYSGERVALIFDEVKFLSIADFEKLVNHMIGNQRFAPLLSDFKKAIAEMGLRPERKFQVIETTAAKIYPENYFYHLEGNAWADNFYIYLRGRTIRECGVVIKADQPHHPLVLLDDQVREERIKEVKEHLKNNTYPKFEEAKIADLQRVNYADFMKSPRTPA